MIITCLYLAGNEVSAREISDHCYLLRDWTNDLCVHCYLFCDWSNDLCVHCYLLCDWLNVFIVRCVLYCPRRLSDSWLEHYRLSIKLACLTDSVKVEGVSDSSPDKNVDFTDVLLTSYNKFSVRRLEHSAPHGEN